VYFEQLSYSEGKCSDCGDLASGFRYANANDLTTHNLVCDGCFKKVSFELSKKGYTFEDFPKGFS